MTRASIYRRSRSSNPDVAFPALVRLGEAQEVSPTTDTGYRAYGAGRLFLPEATVLCTDPQGTSGTFWPASTDHTAITPNTAVPLPITDQPLITKCLKLVNDGTADAPVTANITVSASTSYNSSLYVYCPEFGGNVTVTAETGHSFTVAALTAASSGWTRYSVQSNTVAGEVVLGLKFAFTGGTQTTLYVTGFNPVASAVLTPYGDGTYPGWSWSGTAHASTSVRAASSLKYPRTCNGTKVFSDTGGTLAMRAVPLWTGTAAIAKYPRHLVVQASSNYYGALLAHGYSGDKWFAAMYDNTLIDACEPNVGAVSGTPVSVVGRFANSTSIDCRVNDTSGTQQTTTIANPTYQDTIIVGDDKDAGNAALSYIGPAVISPSRITDAETAALSTMLQAGATGIDLWRFFKRAGYTNTLVLPLAGDSRGYKVV